MELKDMFQGFVNKDYDELVYIANKEINLAMPTLNELVGEEYAYKLMISILATCTSADGTISDLEIKFLTEITGIESSAIVEIVRGTTDYEFVDKILDAISQDLKNHLLTICLCMMAVDENISGKEVAFFKRLLV